VLLNTEIAWLCGFLEGEGCFCMAKRIRNGRNSIHCSFNVTNTDQILIQKARDIMTKIIGIEVSPIRHTVLKGHYKPIWRLWVEKATSLKKFIETLLPFLVGEKKLQATIMLQFIERRIQLRGDNYKAPKFTQDDWKYYDAMQIAKYPVKPVETVRIISPEDKDTVRTATIDKIAELGRNVLTQLN
jgi:hypothetical protein